MKTVGIGQKLKNFEAFSKLYGYIRFFYPGDEAAGINWDKFAVFGMMKVENSQNDEELKTNLEELFTPVAPAIMIYKPGSGVDFKMSSIIPTDTSGLKIVTWQHKGVGLYDMNIYQSVRLNRFSDTAKSFGSVSNSVKAESLRGKKVKLTAALRIDNGGKNGSGRLWLKAEKQGNKIGFSDSSENNPVTVNEWKLYEITGVIDEDAEIVRFGCVLNGEGSLYADDFHLYVQHRNDWQDVKIYNPDFENDKKFMPPGDWEISKKDYFIEVIDYKPFKGKKCLSITSRLKKQLFDKYALPGDVIKRDISSSLFCYFPVSLYSNSSGTIPGSDKIEFSRLENELSDLNSLDLDGNDKFTRLANICIVWNIIQHFYPYFDVVKADWVAALPKYLEMAYNNSDEREFNTTLNMLMAEINDGHAGASCTRFNDNFKPPVILDYVENKVVVSKVLKENIGLLEGDIITAVEGVDVNARIEELKQQVSSATEQWKMIIIVSRLLLKGPAGTEITITALHENNLMDFKLIKDYPLYGNKRSDNYPEYRPENITEIKPGIYYINLDAAAKEDIDTVLPELEKAKGIILDMRGYPSGNDGLITHLIDNQITSARWNVPQIIYPDRENITGYDTSGRWEVNPEKPRIKAKIIYLTNGRAISYAESIMGIVEAYSLGEMLGEPTAGTNGNINIINLLGDYRVYFTGMKVLKHDGSQHHGIGIKPNIPFHRTLKGVKEKRDEFIEKAVDILDNHTKTN